MTDYSSFVIKTFFLSLEVKANSYKITNRDVLRFKNEFKTYTVLIHLSGHVGQDFFVNMSG